VETLGSEGGREGRAAVEEERWRRNGDGAGVQVLMRRSRTDARPPRRRTVARWWERPDAVGHQCHFPDLTESEFSNTD
jgi:hypothetical protein